MDATTSSWLPSITSSPLTSDQHPKQNHAVPDRSSMNASAKWQSLQLLAKLVDRVYLQSNLWTSTPPWQAVRALRVSSEDGINLELGLSSIGQP